MRGKKIHYGFVIVLCCCLMMGVNVGITFSCAGIMYKPVCETLGVSVGQFGLYMAILYVASSVLLPWAGKMIESHSARKLLTASSALMGITLAAMAAFTSVLEFYGAGAVLGLTIAFLLYLSFPTLINRWFRTKVGLLMGVCAAASGIGGIIFNPMAGWIITNYGWRLTYVAYAVIVLVGVTPLLWWLLRDYPEEMGLKPYGAEGAGEGAPKAAATDGVEYSRAVRMPVFYGIFLFSFLMMAVSTLNLFIPNYVGSLGYTLEYASYAAASVMVGVTVGKLLLGHINDRNCLVGVLVTTLAGVVGLLMLIAGNLGGWAVLTGCFLFGWAYAGVMVQTAMLTRTVFGSVSYARIYSIVSIALAAGGAIASGGWGWIVDATSYRAIFIIGVAMLALCVLLGVWAVLARAKKSPAN